MYINHFFYIHSLKVSIGNCVLLSNAMVQWATGLTEFGKRQFTKDGCASSGPIYLYMYIGSAFLVAGSKSEL